MRIALCGNPNVGKTTLYNRLTRSNAPVGNWHGVTVDARGKRSKGGAHTVVDLPGAYSLTARSAEEGVTRDETLFGGYDVIAYVAEVNNLRRNLYMLTQLAEAGKKCILIVNMMDEARGEVDLKLLSTRLGIPVIGTSVKSKNPKDDALSAAERAIGAGRKQFDYYGSAQVRSLADKLSTKSLEAGLPAVFAALKTMEGDGFVSEKLDCGCAANCNACGVCGVADMPARLRYDCIDGLLRGVIKADGKVYRITEKADKIVLGKLALPIFFAVMTAVFLITFEAGKPLSDLLASLTGLIAKPIYSMQAPAWVISLLTDGIVAGVGGVLAFLPQVVILYLLTALLQDSGYMSRVAFVTDDFFKKFGLSGRAAFSVVLGLGCSASAVLTTRGIAGDTARRRTALITPFCPCSARLAVFTAMAAYFSFSGLVVAAMYILGFFAALAVLKILNAVKPDKARDGLIMEMPPYRIPGAKRVARVVFRNTLSFLARVGTTVLAASVIMWILCNFSIGYGYTGGAETSVMNTVAGLLAPIFEPLGFGNWRAVAALISGVAAKETVISVIASMGGMSRTFGSTTAAVSFMIFTCLYVPCVATLSALAKESGIKSVLLSVALHTVVAYAASLVFYQSAVCYVRNRSLFYIVVSVVAAAVAALILFGAIKRIKKRVKIRARRGEITYGKKA